MFIAKKMIFFQKINDKSLYPISNFKINEILKNDKNHIGTFSKNDVLKLKNNQSTIVNLANSFDKGSHWIAMKYIDKNYFILIVMLYHLFQILSKNNILILKL